MVPRPLGLLGFRCGYEVGRGGVEVGGGYKEPGAGGMTSQTDSLLHLWVLDRRPGWKENMMVRRWGKGRSRSKPLLGVLQERQSRIDQQFRIGFLNNLSSFKLHSAWAPVA